MPGSLDVDPFPPILPVRTVTVRTRRLAGWCGVHAVRARFPEGDVTRVWLGWWLVTVLVPSRAELLPIALPLWLVRRLPTWWRARRVVRMMRRVDAEADRLGMEGPPLMEQAAREFAVLVRDRTKNKGRPPR